MEELKTLKYIKLENDSEVNESKREICEAYRGANINFEYKLKQEAIKWIKIAKQIEEGCNKIKNWQGVSYHAGYSKALMVFNNITEEDLK